MPFDTSNIINDLDRIQPRPLGVTPRTVPTPTILPGQQNTPGFFEALLSDPNFQRTLGELGSIGGRGSIGEILGTAGSNLARRRAMQRAGAGQAERQKTFQDRLIQALAGGQLLSDPTDNTRPDSMTIDGKGNVTLKAGMADQPVGFPGEQQPLEAMTGGGAGLRDFFRASLV